MPETGPPIPTSTFEYYHALPAPEAPRPRERYWVHALLLLATVFTTLVVGARMQFNFVNDKPPFAAGDELLPFFPISWILAQPSRLLLGIPFSAALLGILLAHEMGHYLLCRYYGVRATLPFFIPAPTMIGTLGAVIRIKAPIRTRAALFDIGITGPIAGFVVALPVLALAMYFSKPLTHPMTASDLRLGFPWIFRLVHEGLRWMIPNHPIAALPLRRIYLHPVAVAAWVGMYATALNLLPSGQLDGGHIVFALSPRAHRVISWITILGLAYLGTLSSGWWFWAGLITLMNILTFRHQQAPPYPDIPGSRWELGFLALILLLLTFTIAPIQIMAK